MATIHPSSIIDSTVKCADDVTIGPWCHLRGDITIGSGTEIMERVSMQGPLSIGENNVFYPGVSVGFPPQDFKFDRNDDGMGTTIGNDNTFREGVSIHRGTTQRATSVGNDNYLMVNSHMGHDSVIHNNVLLINGALLGGHVEIFDKALVSGNCGVHQFVRIGRMAMVGANSLMSRDLPPFCMCASTRRVHALNIVGLRRSGYRENIKPLQRAFDIYFKDKHTSPKALEIIDQEVGDDPLVKEFSDFIKNTKRGIVKYSASDE